MPAGAVWFPAFESGRYIERVCGVSGTGGLAMIWVLALRSLAGARSVGAPAAGATVTSVEPEADDVTAGLGGLTAVSPAAGAWLMVEPDVVADWAKAAPEIRAAAEAAAINIV